LPWVPIDKQYRFNADEGSASLEDLFRGRSQLLVYHFMFGPDYKSGCPSCSAIADGFNGFVVHLANHDIMLWAVSQAPLAKLQAYKRRMGWTFPWASSFGSDFNSDFNVSVTEEQQRARDYEYNYRRGAAPQSATRPGAMDQSGHAADIVRGPNLTQKRHWQIEIPQRSSHPYGREVWAARAVPRRIVSAPHRGWRELVRSSAST
jgi:predicted dithiol-disulfide oxidoreductase (DUF899 family)